MTGGRPTPGPASGRAGAEVPRLRRLLAAAVVVLLALWAYAAYAAARDATDLLRVRALAETLGHPTDRLILDLQTERRLTAGAVAGIAPASAALGGARDGTDRTIAALRDAATGTDLRLLTAGAVRDRAAGLLLQLDGLPAVRADADAGRADAVTAYDQLIDAAFAVYGPEWSARESTLAAETRAVVALARSRELLAREDTLLTATLAAGRPSADERRRLSDLVSTRRYAGSEAAAALPPAEQDDYRRLTQEPLFTALRSLEDRLLRAGDDGPTAAEWEATAEPALAALDALVRSTARHSVERAAPDAALVVVRAGAVLGLGPIALLALLLGGVRVLRRLPDADAGATRRLAPTAADRTAELGVVTGPGPATTAAPDRATGAGPRAVPGPDPAGRVHTGPPAPGAPHRSAAAGGDAYDAARATRDLFLRLTQRNQVLLREQLALLDVMERREHSPEETAELFQLDHLATRLRRNVEKLVTLAGARPARRWRRSVPMLDVARGAVAEVADYQRVLVAPHWPWSLAGPAVTDVIHLLAELIENALAFSPAGTAVRVAGEQHAGGCAVVVSDDGPGLHPAAAESANRMLADPPTACPPNGPHGLYAAALLAARCGARVRLQPGPRGGTSAVVLLPTALVTPTGPDGAAPGPGGPRSTPPARPSAGGLPVRARHAGAAWPGSGTAGADTVEIPVSRAARGRP
ncbi:sensor histidine kinase [Micromonospora globbae]|uniref:sensor histidine kinase n=1 Tax=Micromonospora globbae TaxID=1894969 RepID=UPI003791760E